METKNNIRHIAFIMDGNGRWAKKRMMPREYGHKFGAKKFKDAPFGRTLSCTDNVWNYGLQ